MPFEQFAGYEWEVGVLLLLPNFLLLFLTGLISLSYLVIVKQELILYLARASHPVLSIVVQCSLNLVQPDSFLLELGLSLGLLCTLLEPDSIQVVFKQLVVGYPLAKRYPLAEPRYLVE